jgi:hypothetical protein
MEFDKLSVDQLSTDLVRRKLEDSYEADAKRSCTLVPRLRSDNHVVARRCSGAVLIAAIFLPVLRQCIAVHVEASKAWLCAFTTRLEERRHAKQPISEVIAASLNTDEKVAALCEALVGGGSSLPRHTALPLVRAAAAAHGLATGARAQRRGEQVDAWLHRLYVEVYEAAF